MFATRPKLSSEQGGNVTAQAGTPFDVEVSEGSIPICGGGKGEGGKGGGGIHSRLESLERWIPRKGVDSHELRCSSSPVGSMYLVGSSHAAMIISPRASARRSGGA